MHERTTTDTLGDDQEVLANMEELLLASASGRDRLRTSLAALFRQAIDEVIDTPRTRRRLIGDLEKTEKTYIGTKVEILFRNFLRLPKGNRLDLLMGGRDVDVKFTIHNNWTIPLEAVNEVCLLLSCAESKATFCVGLIVVRDEHLNRSTNRDQKRTISSTGKLHIRWIFRDEPYPPNFWSNILPEDAEYIMEMAVNGNERIRRLFIALVGRPVPRRIVESVAQQKDFMKRLRKNGGARDQLHREGYRLLSAAYDAAEIARHGLPPCSEGEFICVRDNS